MEKLFDINHGGYSVRCKLFYGKDIHAVENVVVVMHGFGSGKDGRSTVKFGERLIAKYHNYAALAFDWPCHGADARKKLVLEECLAYLESVVGYVRTQLGAKRIYAYANSFGGYLTLNYMEVKGNPFHKVALRAPAVQMYQTLWENMSEDERGKVEKGREIMLGFERKMKIGKEFLDALRSADVMRHDYLDDADNMLILHGTADEMIDIGVSKAFAENNVIELMAVEGADHPFSQPKHMDLAIQKIIGFFAD
ncbi:alpha/beta hydrolase [Neisseria sp. CCUG12390]|uniref:alpha/beta hydrolase n=1 Tax=Neisseria sp. CCUG12390 TaxID=3392035 RepID=UPI003A102FD1